MSHDGSGPDRGFTGETPEPSIVGNDHVYDDEDYDPPFCNDFHDSHMEVHREFWDILDFGMSAASATESVRSCDAQSVMRKLVRTARIDMARELGLSKLQLSPSDVDCSGNDHILGP